MSRRRLRAERGAGGCPLSDLLVQYYWRGAAEEWWSGVVPGVVAAESSRQVLGPAARLVMTGDVLLSSAADTYWPRRRTRLQQVRGEVRGCPLDGVVDQPGFGGLARRRLTRHGLRVRLRTHDGRCWFLRASGINGSSVATDSGDPVLWRGTGADVTVRSEASVLDVAVGLLLLTAVDRRAILVVGGD